MRLFKITYVIEIGDSPETKKLLNILEQLVEDPKGDIKKSISDKLKKLKDDLEKTV